MRKAVPVTNPMANAKDYTIQAGRLVRYCGKETRITVPDDVTSIGRRAFYRNATITSVTLPAGVDTVEQEAFEYCHALKEINILGTIKTAGVRAFGSFDDPKKKELEISVYASVPIRAFTKAAQEAVLRTFSRRFSEFDQKAEAFRDNLNFIGTHLKQPQAFQNDKFYHFLSDNSALRHAVLDADAIPIKDVDWLVDALQAEGNTAFVAELLDYRNRILLDGKIKQAQERSQARAEKKALNAEMSAADWRKLLKFSYEDGAVVIKEVRIKEPVIELPDRIGERRVRVIDRRAFSYNLKPGEKELWSPDKIVIPEGVEEIRKGAFYCVSGAEIFFPATIRALPEGCFVAAENLILHLPATIEELPEELSWDDFTPIKAIHAPAGSYAEKYAKEHGVPFVVEE